MNISATQNVKLATAGRGRTPLPLAAHGARHRHRDHHRGHRGLAAHRACARAWSPFSRNSGRTTSSSTRPPATPARSRPRSASAGRCKPEYAEVIRRWSTLGGGRRPAALHSARWWTASRSRRACPASNRRTSTWRGNRRTWARSRRAISPPGRYFTPEEDQRARARRDDRLQRGGVAVSRRHGAGQHHDDGRRRVHHHRRLCQGEGRLLRRERPGQRHHHSAAHGREPLPAGGPLHDHRQGEDRQARRRLSRKCRASCAASAAWPPARRTISPSPRPTRSSSSSTASPA